jgi:hypothetical protein
VVAISIHLLSQMSDLQCIFESTNCNFTERLLPCSYSPKHGRSLFGPGSGNFNSLLRITISLFRSLGNSLKKRSDLAGFELIKAPGSASKTRNSLYFSLIAGNSLGEGFAPDCVIRSQCIASDDPRLRGYL